MASRFGYARAWSQDRDTAAQQAELEVMGCREVRVEMTPGPADKTLPELKDIIGSINEGDTLVVTRARVLGRTTRNVLSAIAAIGDRGAFVEILMPPRIDRWSRGAGDDECPQNGARHGARRSERASDARYCRGEGQGRLQR